LVENDHKQKTNGEIDPFSRFWFGNSKHRETDKESENNSQEFRKQNEHTSFDRNSNRIDDWSFGLRRREPTKSTPTTQDQIENFLNNLDIELLMETYDSLVTTSKQLKPLIKEISPIFHQIRNKFKSN
jgi:hypothetical protein